MLVVAFIITALAGVMVGIWLAARTAASQVSMTNPAKVWAFADTLKRRAVFAYSEELTHALELKYNGNEVKAQDVASFITEYTDTVLKHSTTRR